MSSLISLSQSLSKWKRAFQRAAKHKKNHTFCKLINALTVLHLPHLMWMGHNCHHEKPFPHFTELYVYLPNKRVNLLIYFFLQIKPASLWINPILFIHSSNIYWVLTLCQVLGREQELAFVKLPSWPSQPHGSLYTTKPLLVFPVSSWLEIWFVLVL